MEKKKTAHCPPLKPTTNEKKKVRQHSGRNKTREKKSTYIRIYKIKSAESCGESRKWLSVERKEEMQQKEKWFGESTFNSIKKKKEKLWIAIQELGNKQKHSICFFSPFRMVEIRSTHGNKQQKKKGKEEEQKQRAHIIEIK